MTEPPPRPQPGTLTGRERLRLTVHGIVQGVGFRPFVYGLATRLGLVGHVGNDSGGVFIEVEGDAHALAAFQIALRTEPPPAAHIDAVTVTPIPVRGDDANRSDPSDSHDNRDSGFVIVHSEPQPHAATLISPDLAICDDCLRELFDPADRRYRYPFINCTNCGPRFTIIDDIPYDRPRTTMRGFSMCPACQREYDDPRDRRFHAQPNACPVCGPRVWLANVVPQGERTVGEAALRAAQDALRRGQIVAVKGLGGFHLACLATDDAALNTLRARKGRVAKPFAVMVRDLDMAQQIAHVSAQEASLLTSRERPILLLRKREGGRLSDQVAPGNPFVGVMLPYTPLHHLLIEEAPLVMTSGNFSGEPIVKDDEVALDRLSALADVFLLHDRLILAHCDDSVVRMVEGRELPIRRSRGYTPFPVRLPFEVTPLLAVGGELKNTFCLTRAAYGLLSQHIGDMENLETLAAFDGAVAHLSRLLRVEPTVLVCDKHPGYLSTHWADRTAAERKLPLIRVQHHHAHIAAVMAENGAARDAQVIGVCLDGTGYGDDGAIWGGEFLIGGYHGYQRAAHLRYVPLAGGDVAVKRPYRMALAVLYALGLPWAEDLPPVAACPEAERRVLRRQLEAGLNVVPTSSAGRLFDAVAALAGVRQVVSYEAQAAIELEGLAEGRETAAYEFEVVPAAEGGLVIDPAPVLAALVADVRSGIPASRLSARFHRGLAAVIGEVCARLRGATGIEVVALSGGVFQNVTLLGLVLGRLRAAQFDVLTHHLVPPNDGGVALGQAIVGGVQLA